jgi:hypothetical protein
MLAERGGMFAILDDDIRILHRPEIVFMCRQSLFVVLASLCFAEHQLLSNSKTT